MFRTADPAANTTEPTGEYAGSGWQFEGTFGDYLATPIAPHFLLTAQHIGGAPKFTFRGRDYTLVRSFDDPESDLRIWEVAETLPAYAQIYAGRGEVGQHLVVIGRGTQRGAERIVNGERRGWEWGRSDNVQRWGENQVAAIKQSAHGADLLYALFDQNGLLQEAHLSGGDSGGAVFINDDGVWKLAGINYDADSFASGPDAGGPYTAALYDERGSYTSDGTLVSGPAPVPSGFYATRIATRSDWIASIITPHLANISARSSVRTGEQVCIAGFIIEGAADATKRVIVRGLGPSLAANGVPVPGRMPDPVLELHNASGAIISSNSNWQDSQAALVQDSGLAPASPAEAALVATLPPGPYTALLRDATSTTGLGLMEVYDLDPTSGARLLNLSTRAFVGTGDDVLIGGVIVRSVSSRLLLRALGPELSAQNVDAVLQNPQLELYDANGALIAANDDWKNGANASAIAQTGLAPKENREAAILVAGAAANSYTAIVRGAGNTSGVALLEAYLLD